MGKVQPQLCGELCGVIEVITSPENNLHWGWPSSPKNNLH